MPEMFGPELGELQKKTRPDVRVMLRVRRGPVGAQLGMRIHRQAFLAKKLVEMVTEVLHAPDNSQGSNQFDKRKRQSVRIASIVLT